MFLLNSDPGKITASELQGLIDNQVIESRDIEYKRTVAIGSKAEERKKIKFLAGISSFANSDGGDFLIGIRAEDGIPKEIVPIERLELDALKLAAEQLIQTGISPRISPGVHESPVSATHSALLLRVAKSWAGPHRVTLARDNNFYGRHSAGMYPMDVDQLRAAFLLWGSIHRRVKVAQQELLAAILTEAPEHLAAKPWVILHLIPFEALDAMRSISIEEADRRRLEVARPDGLRQCKASIQL